MKKLIALMYNDIRNIVREPILLFIMLGPLLMTIALRFFIPFVGDLLYSNLRFNLEPFYKLITSYVILFVPMLTGTMMGFLLLDEKDDNVITTLIVTPLAKKGYLTYRITIPIVLSIIYSIITIPILGLVKVQYGFLLPIAIIVSMEAPIIALYLSVFAGNKVEGLALSKGLGIFMLSPLLGYFFTSPLRFIAGVIPFYWPVHAFIIAEENIGLYWIYILIGLLVHVIYLKVFISKFEQKIC